MSAGSSTTPLATKLGVREGNRVLLLHASSGWVVDDLPANVSVARRRSASQSDVVIAFFTQLATLRRELTDLSQQITVSGSLWLAWPRRAGGHESDITDNHVRAAALPLGLVDVKVAALDADWSSLKFVWRKERRPDHASGRL
ncbi:MAG TPA: DUF3052 domain-containing protein [Acidimicrobiales bacterium]